MPLLNNFLRCSIAFGDPHTTIDSCCLFLILDYFHYSKCAQYLIIIIYFFLFALGSFLSPSQEYCARTPAPTGFLFVVDVSYAAIQSGMLASVCQVLITGKRRRPRDCNAHINHKDRLVVTLQVMFMKPCITFY